MINLDQKKKEDALLQKKIKDAVETGDPEKFANAMMSFSKNIENRVLEQYELDKSGSDTQILNTRGERQLTSKENKFYNKLADAMRSSNPTAALEDPELTIPETVFETVFDDLKTKHPLLSKINLKNTTGVTKWLMSKDGYQVATWGKLNSEIIKEIEGGFEEIDTMVNKLSAFMFVSKDMLALGAKWLDRYVRELLYEVESNGAEAGFVNGDGVNGPIGMNRDVSKDAIVQGGVQPLKEVVKINDFSPQTMGNLAASVSISENGKPRTITDFVLIVNTMDYYDKIMPATTILLPDGTYRGDIFPIKLEIIQSNAVEKDRAIFGSIGKYFANVSLGKEPAITYSDEYKFLEDFRTYVVRLYGNGIPQDNNAFINLDISDLKPVYPTVETITSSQPIENTLSSLGIEGVALSPIFSPDTVTYTATATEAKNTVKASPANASAEIEVTVNGKKINNGAMVTWKDDINDVIVKVTGDTKKEYKITVTKEAI